jgi:hypothetical protein
MRKITGPKGYPTEITRADDSISLRVPLGSNDELVGWLSLDFARNDPLAISLMVRSPSRATVLERTILRSDLRSAMRSSVRYAALLVEPAPTKGFTSFQFEETHIIVTAVVPSDILDRFLGETDEMVPPGQAETEALSAALADIELDQNA